MSASAIVLLLVTAIVMAVCALLRAARRQGRSDMREEYEHAASDTAKQAAQIRDRLEHDGDFAQRVRKRFRRRVLSDL